MLIGDVAAAGVAALVGGRGVFMGNARTWLRDGVAAGVPGNGD